MSVKVNIAIRFNYSLVSSKNVLKYRYNLIDYAMFALFAASLKAFSSLVKRLQHLNILSYYRPISCSKASLSLL